MASALPQLISGMNLPILTIIFISLLAKSILNLFCRLLPFRWLDLLFSWRVCLLDEVRHIYVTRFRIAFWKGLLTCKATITALMFLKNIKAVTYNKQY